MAAPITSEASQYSRTTFLEPAICRPKPPHSNPRPIWHDEDLPEHIKVPSVDPALFGSDSSGSRGYSNSFLRSSADDHSSRHTLPPPLTEPPSPRPYFEFGLVPSYSESPQYHLSSRDPHTSNFPLRQQDDWSLTRTPTLQGSQEPFWGQSRNALAGLPELSHRRSYSTISSDAVSTPARETDPQISPISPESWERQCIEVRSPHSGQHPPSPTPRTTIAPWFSESSDGTSRAHQPTYAARMRTSQACQKCRSRKAKVRDLCSGSLFMNSTKLYSVTVNHHARDARPED